MKLTQMEEEPNKGHDFHPIKKYVTTNLDVILLAPLQDNIKAKGTRHVMNTTMTNIINETSNVILETSVIQNFDGEVVEVGWAIYNAKWVASPLTKALQSGKCGFLNGKRIDGYLPEPRLQINLEEYGVLAYGTDDVLRVGLGI